MRSHIATREGTLTVTSVRPDHGSITRFDPEVMLAADEGWLSFTATLSPTEARRLADLLIAAADETDGR